MPLQLILPYTLKKIEMRFLFAFVFIITTVVSAFGQEKEVASSNYSTSVQEITAMLNQDAKYWSEGNIDAFMESYIKSDSLVFVGSRGLTYGWQKTLENYKKGYPTKEHMGELSFDLLEFKQLTANLFFVIGKYKLKRTVGDASGHFSILLKKMDGKWKIIADHSS